MHLAHVIKGLGRGGAESLLPLLVRRGGADLRFSVVYFLPWKDALVGELQALGATVECLGGTSTPAVLMRSGRLSRWARAHGVDVIHAHLPASGVVARLAGRRCGVPVVYTEHNLQERYRWPTRLLNRLTWTLHSRAVAVSQGVAASIDKGISPRSPTIVVPNGIEVPTLASTVEGLRARRSLGIDPSVPVVGTVAVFRPQKRMDIWMRMAALVAFELGEVEFLVIGDGPLRAEIESDAARVGVRNRVRFTGLRHDARDLLSAMDVFVSTSQFEGLPLAVLEAMAAALPVVATRVGGVPEAIEDGSSGVLVEFGDDSATAAAVCRLLRAPERRRSLGAAARQRVKERFEVGRMAARLEELYREVMLAGPSG